MKSSLRSLVTRWLAPRPPVRLAASARGVIGDEAALRERSIPTERLPYDENLLERARTQWQLGDWENLARITRDTLEYHPDRAKLVLFAAAGHLQTDNAFVAKQLIQLARTWGCGKKVLSRILVSGLHNSLGRAAALASMSDNMRRHFQIAIELVIPGSTSGVLAKARMTEQLTQLQLPVPASTSAGGGMLALRDPEDLANKTQKASDDSIEYLSKNLSKSLKSGDSSGVNSSLADIASRMKFVASDEEPCNVSWTSISYGERDFHFVHVAEDYIPRKIKIEQRFYEHDFLAFLGTFHQPSGVIVDCGANIGNHSVYFAGILGANVVAIEPEPHNALCLAINVCLNDISEQVQIFVCAAGQHDDTIFLRMNVESNYGSFTANATPNAAPVAKNLRAAVKVKALDDLLSALLDEHKHISIIKIDVEGMELDVLKGAEKLIQSCLPLITVECFSFFHLTQIEKFLDKYGYAAIEAMNATPTFIFASRRSLFHRLRLADYLRNRSVDRARNYEGFDLVK